jgi:hypothetical protein
MAIRTAVLDRRQNDDLAATVFMMASATCFVAAVTALPRPAIEFAAGLRPLPMKSTAAIAQCAQEPWPYYESGCLQRSNG